MNPTLTIRQARHRVARPPLECFEHPERTRSPAPATPAASSPAPTPSETRWRLAEYLEARVSRSIGRSTSTSRAVNNSCAQHYIGDIGLRRRPRSRSSEEMVEGYHLVRRRRLGGRARGGASLDGFAPVPEDSADRRAADRPLPDEPRRTPDESFATFVRKPPDRSLAPRSSPESDRPRLTSSLPSIPGPLAWPLSLIPDSAPFNADQSVPGSTASLPAGSASRTAPRNALSPISALNAVEGPDHARAGRGRSRARRLPLARPGARHRRPPVKLAEGKPKARPADGRDGAARLRGLRLPLPDLLRGHRQRRREARSPSARRAGPRRRRCSRSSSRSPRRQRRRPPSPPSNGSIKAEPAGWSRKNPYQARLIRKYRQPEPSRARTRPPTTSRSTSAPTARRTRSAIRSASSPPTAATSIGEIIQAALNARPAK